MEQERANETDYTESIISLDRIPVSSAVRLEILYRLRRCNASLVGSQNLILGPLRLLRLWRSEEMQKSKKSVDTFQFSSRGSSQDKYRQYDKQNRPASRTLIFRTNSRESAVYISSSIRLCFVQEVIGELAGCDPIPLLCRKPNQNRQHPPHETAKSPIRAGFWKSV
jgi:hypothetical protein